jgi:hypothetical protein
MFRTRTVRSLLATAAFCAAPALGQVYQRADTTPVWPGGVAGSPTFLQAVAATSDGGYIAVGRDGGSAVHLARYDAAGNVLWSRFMLTSVVIAQATSINLLSAGANPTYVVAGEIADDHPYGTWVMIIDINGNVTCPMREINGVGPNAPLGRSPVAVKPLQDGSYVVTGHSQPVDTDLARGRLTRFNPGCTDVMWSMVYTPTSTAGIGLTGECEITDVVEEPQDPHQDRATLLAVGTATTVNNAFVPFLLRVDKATGAPVFAKFYGTDNTANSTHGDGLAVSYDLSGAVDGYIFDGRSSFPTPSPTSNLVIKVDMAGLSVIWGELFPSFGPCHACIRTSSSNMLIAGAALLAGTHIASDNTPDVRGVLIDSGTGSQSWSFDYGLGLDRGNGVDIAGTPLDPDVGPIIVGTGGTSAAQNGYLVKARIATGSSGGCEIPEPAPPRSSFEIGAEFTSQAVQDFRVIGTLLNSEDLQTVNACVHPQPPCNADFNGDGDVGTDADIYAFFQCLAGNCCPTCGPADFNGDGDVGTDADIRSFFSVLAGGPC